MDKIRIFALGGLDEDGKNMYAVEINDEIVLIEAGIKYPESSKLGVEKIIPDFTYILDNIEKVKGIFITHAHDDVVGALPYLLRDASHLDVYATPLNANIIQGNLVQYGIKSANIKKIKRGAKVKLGNIEVDTFATTHSIGESIGLAIKTNQGYIVYTGEFIVDFDARDEAFSCDVSKIAELGNMNVLCLLTESIAASRKGHTAPNHRILDMIEPYFETAQGRIVISMYAQNIYRAIEILNLAIRYKRKVVIYGNELRYLLDKIVSMGYLTIPVGLLVDPKKMDPNDPSLVIVVSGSGPNIFRFMNRIALHEDDTFNFVENDTIIIASPIVPGTEKEASNMENELYKLGPKIITLSGKQVYSMHASSEDLKMMMYLLKPNYYMPIRGEYRQLIDNANVATSMGITPDRIVVLDNGQVAEFENGRLKSTSGSVPIGEVLIDGSEELDSSGVVIKDREQLSTDGVIVVGVVIDFNTKEVIGGPDVQMRGFVYLKDADHIVTTIMKICEDTIQEMHSDNRYDNLSCKGEMRDKIAKYVLKETGKRPMILPAIVEINA